MDRVLEHMLDRHSCQALSSQPSVLVMHLLVINIREEVSVDLGGRLEVVQGSLI
jgi:hypothetical protein